MMLDIAFLYIAFVMLRYSPSITSFIWWWCMIFLMCGWVWFAIILLRIFALMLIKEMACNPLFLLLLCPCLFEWV
jgi:hypothetical protein